MEQIEVHSHSHSYQVVIGENIRFQLKEFLPKTYSSILIITDDHVSRLFLDDIIQGFDQITVNTAIIPAGEKSKSIQQFYDLHTKALEVGLDRSSLIMALGGGVVGDLAGFVAATFMRGIDFVQVPTTILAHDSSVGGKVAINHELGKNLIGSFHSPKMVIYDVETLRTLPFQEIRSGYAELIKEALLADGDFYARLIDNKLSDLDTKELVHYLQKGIGIKANIVQNDEKELGTRKFLNLGHTLGHALEAELGYGVITHGEAVAIGIVFALYVSEKEFSIELNSSKLYQWLLENDYPLRFNKIDYESVLNRMKSDKKAVKKTIQMILLRKLTDPVIVDMSDQKIAKYIQAFFEKLENWR